MNNIRIRLSRLEVIAFVSGFVLMVFELAGARILAPGIGSSTYVWTSVIGVIIAALSLGYWLGGRVADTRGYMIDVARLALLSAFLIVVMMMQYEGVIDWVADTFDDPRLQGVIASLLLFAPTSFALGTISPYLAKLNIRSLTTTGRAVASLSALNSIGGIVGTFTAGFILFGYIGSHETLALTAMMMALVSWIVVPRIERRLRLAVTAAIIVLAVLPMTRADAISIDTPSARYTVYDAQGMRLLATGPYGAQSGIALGRPHQLVFWYTQQLAQVVEQAPQKQSILILGGGAFTLPQYLAQQYPDSTIDTVEIDPELAAIAREHFGYRDPQNVNLIFEDARTYVNQTTKQYDIVIVDVYGDTHVPFTLLTREYGERIATLTKPEGIVAANLIAGMEGSCRYLLGALDAPYRQRFKEALYSVEDPKDERSNIIAVYSHRPIEWSAGRSLNIVDTSPYDDNFAPAERLQHDCRRQ